ncbi:fructosamine kinase family protein [Phaeacidiphilus oryzae]|uniref:fructosamine kinase family protein n=1 Tax=Phaeacidiphilus oryzae TaxID=348818 RepID=UPI000562DD6E|nr:fructosamine kinase family protein [Phaeacidiphilus oryzae]
MPEDRTRAAAAAAERLTGRAVSDPRPMPGGDGGSALTRVRLADGGAAVVKRGQAPRAVPAEAAGLRWLAEAGAPTPAVLGADEEWLVIEAVPEGSAGPAEAEELGRRLARTHAAGAPAFGSPPPGGPADAWIGRAPMRNREGRDWPAWYAEHRLLPYLRTAVDRGSIEPGAEAGAIEEVCSRLPRLAGPPEPPARLHGDLWSGNVLWAGAASGDARLIDPAAHGGHRETDLAMLRLFGCPQLDRILTAYQEETPLADGWAERVPLHQLFPLLVHAALFGGGYGGQAVAAARTALARG